jgi:hypothetical protein
MHLIIQFIIVYDRGIYSFTRRNPENIHDAYEFNINKLFAKYRKGRPLTVVLGNS